MATSKTQAPQDNQEKINAQVSKTEQFYKENKKTIWCCFAVVVVVVLAILAYRQFIYEPKVVEAQEQMFPAEASFQAGEFETALNGDGNNLGFADIIGEYGAKAGKSVFFYAGVCELQLGNYDSAISYLKKYNGKDKILEARAVACIGDAYTGLEDYQTAARYFESAAKKIDNIYAAEYLLKAGVANEELGNKDAALKCYETIKDKYPQSVEGYDIDKYISRIKISE